MTFTALNQRYTLRFILITAIAALVFLSVTALPAIAQLSPEQVAETITGGAATSFNSAASFTSSQPAGASWKTSLFDRSVAAKAQGGTPSGSSDAWHYQFTPYLFLPSFKGTAAVNGREIGADASSGDVLSNLNFAFMGAFEARRNKFILLTDIVYANLADSNATPGPLFSSAHADFKAFILDPEVGYRLAEKNGASFDVLAGFRYWHMSTRFDLRAGVLPATQVDDSKNWVDPVIGLRGKIPLSPRFFLTAKGDLGGFGVGSHFTWQLFGGVGANLGKSMALILGYRYLDVDYSDSSSGFLFDMAIKGPVIGFGFRF
jgi:hypothetical protein